MPSRAMLAIAVTTSVYPAAASASSTAIWLRVCRTSRSRSLAASHRLTNVVSSPPPLPGGGEAAPSLEGRGEQDAAVEPQRVAAAFQLEERAHADRALVRFTVVSDRFDRVVHPVLRQTEHRAEIALGAEQAAHLRDGRGLHLVDVLRGDAEGLGRDRAVEHPAHDVLPLVVAVAHHRALRVVRDRLGEDGVVVGLLELLALA